MLVVRINLSLGYALKPLSHTYDGTKPEGTCLQSSQILIRFSHACFKILAVPPHCFSKGSEASFLFHLQKTSKFSFEIWVSFPIQFKELCGFCKGRSSWLSGVHLKHPLCLSASLIGLADLQTYSIFFTFVFCLAFSEAEGGPRSLREADLSEMIKCLKMLPFILYPWITERFFKLS